MTYYNLFKIEIAKRKRKCKICEEEIEAGKSCAVWVVGSMHHECFLTQIVHCYNQGKLNELYDKSFGEIVNDLVAKSI